MAEALVPRHRLRYTGAMARLYPPDPAMHDTGAERVVWEALRDQLPPDAVVFADVGLLDGTIEREIDLLVAWPGVGLAAIEVKGGAVQRVDGQWWQGSGAERHAIDPVYQVQQARHALTRLVDQHGLDAAHARSVHLVALPHVQVPPSWETPDLPRSLVIGRQDLGSAADRVKRAIQEHGQGQALLPESAVEPLVTYLTGPFPSQVDVLARAAEHEDHLDQLTHDQARLLDLFREHRRLQVLGAAGTGKTWLALEQARRLSRAGERVALLCYSRGLGRYLRQMTQTWPTRDRPAYVGLFHDLPVQWGAAAGDPDDSTYWERDLPLALGELAAGRPPGDLFDSVVVDEAQDFGELWWRSLLRCLRDPDAGGLFVFLDEGQRVFDRDGAVPMQVAPITLQDNLRSTKQIAQLCGSLRADVVRPRGWSGAPVRIVDVPLEQAVSAADDAVEALLDEGWQPGQVALLATGARHPQQVDVVGGSGYPAYWDEFFRGEDVFYGHVLGFKGLERTVVVLAVNGFHDEGRARTLLYTGMSRARTLLVVVGPRAGIERIGGEAVRRRLAEARAWAVC